MEERGNLLGLFGQFWKVALACAFLLLPGCASIQSETLPTPKASGLSAIRVKAMATGTQTVETVVSDPGKIAAIIEILDANKSGMRGTWVTYPTPSYTLHFETPELTEIRRVHGRQSSVGYRWLGPDWIGGRSEKGNVLRTISKEDHERLMGLLR